MTSPGTPLSLTPPEPVRRLLECALAARPYGEPLPPDPASADAMPMLVEQRPLDPVRRHPRPVHVHCHWLFFDHWAPSALATLTGLGVADDRVAWLRARLPFPLPAAEATPDVQREPVIASGPAGPGSGQAAVRR
jgi:hypothetical protein